MSFDFETLCDLVETHGRVTRVVIADVKGSSPREVGAAMLVWNGGQAGTIGGGALEFEAAVQARDQIESTCVIRRSLGPDLGQCCGGAVTLVSEVYDPARLQGLDVDILARSIKGDGAPSLQVKRLLADARGQGQRPVPQLVDGWLVEPISRRQTPLWIWGAGHVGRALVDVLSPLPDLEITWVDTGPERFPDDIPDHVTALPAAEPTLLVKHAPQAAHHLILTYSHALDLALCNALLVRGFSFAGLIGSATKWARFRSRLAQMGHTAQSVARITCPIGDPTLGKHPQMIAIGVAAALLNRSRAEQNEPMREHPKLRPDTREDRRA